MKLLTDEQLVEVDRIISEAVVETDWDHDANDPSADSFEIDDAQATLRKAARSVREYLQTLERND